MIRIRTAIAAIVFAGLCFAQQAPAAKKAPAAKQAQSKQDESVKAYVDLLRKDVKAEKVQIMTAVMQLSPDDAAIFWPIYKAYDTELTKFSDQKLAVIRDYADNYGKLTDAKADELVTRMLNVKQQRDAALRKCYESMKAKLGGLKAARFLQTESQLLSIIDLQISALLPPLE